MSRPPGWTNRPHGGFETGPAQPPSFGQPPTTPGTGSPGVQGSPGAQSTPTTPFVFSLDDVPGSATTPLLFSGKSGTVAQMPYKGSVVGISFTSNEAKTGGTARFSVFVQDTDTNFSASWSTGSARGFVTTNPGTNSFSPGQNVSVKAVTSGFTPITADVTVTVFVAFSGS